MGDVANTKRFLTLLLSPSEHAEMCRRSEAGRARMAATIAGMSEERLLAVLDAEDADLVGVAVPDGVVPLQRVVAAAS